MPICVDSHWAVVAIFRNAPDMALIVWSDGMYLEKPTGILQVVKEVYENMFDRLVFAVNGAENWRNGSIIFGLQTDEFSCSFYLFTAMRTTEQASSAMPHMFYSNCEETTNLPIRKTCKRR